MKKSRWVVIVCVVVLLALVVVFFLYRDAFLPGEKAALKEPAGIVSERPESREEVVRKRIELAPPKEEPPPPPPVVKEVEVRRDVVQERVEELFQYLDRQEYVRAYHLEEGTYRHFLAIASKLSLHLPVVSGEMDELSILRNNMAHLFRVMGKEDVSLVLDILSHEEERIEDAMALLYEWGVREAERRGGAIGADRGDLYEYAVFFLNTVGGKAYLLRRESRIRILLTYYAVLTLDRANAQRLNRHGVDILPHLDLLIDDIERYGGLEHRDRYLRELKAIRGRYHG